MQRRKEEEQVRLERKESKQEIKLAQLALGVPRLEKLQSWE